MNSFVHNLQFFNREAFYGLGKNPQLCIIGNGGSSLEDEEKIRKADCVIRFNNYATREGIGYTQDRFRCDMLFTTGDLHSVGAAPKSVVLGIPYPFKCGEVTQRLSKWYPRSKSYMVNPYMTMQMCKELEIPSEGWKHPFPSIGFTCVWHIFQLMKIGFAPKIHISGFNWYYQDGRIQGWDMKKQNYPSHWNHNYPKEVRWMIQNILHHPSFTFSSPCLKILREIKAVIGNE